MIFKGIEISQGLLHRFWKKVDKAPGHGPRGDCWVWTGCKGSQGYGWIYMGRVNERPRVGSTHRLSYAIHKGPPPDELDVLHECDNPPCINPAHLFLGTQDDNMKDCARKGRTARGEGSPRHKLTEAQVLEARRLYEAGATFTALSRKYGISHAMIHSSVTGKHWRHLPGAATTRGYRRALNDDEVIEMRRLYAAGGLQFREIGDRFGVPAACAAKAITGRTYGHLPGAMPSPYQSGGSRRHY